VPVSPSTAIRSSGRAQPNRPGTSLTVGNSAARATAIAAGDASH
jgi:hypothetical protein